jgi:O-antigen/teichoic acid export membrane protein
MPATHPTSGLAPPAGAPQGEAKAPRLATNAAWRFGGTLVRVALGLVNVPVLTHYLGMSQWGILALLQAATAPLVLIDMGIGGATVKYVAEHIGRRDVAGATRVAQTSILFYVGAGLLGTATLLAAAPWLATSVFAIPAAEVPLAKLGFRVAAIGWFAALLRTSFASVLSAHQRYDQHARLGALGAVAATALGIAAAISGGNVVDVVLVQSAATAATALLYFRAAAHLLPGLRGLPRWHGDAFRRSASFGAWQTVAMAGTLLSGWSDRYILGALFAPAVVGFYAIAQTLYANLYVAFVEMGEVLFPAVSHREGAGDLAGARGLSLLVGWTLTTVFGACATVLAVLGGDFIGLWVGADAARQATGILRLLCVGGIVGMLAVAPLHYAAGIGRTRWQAAAATVTGATVAATTFALAPRLGLPGVGYGLVAGVVARTLLLPALWRRHFAAQYGFGAFSLHVFAPPLASLAIAAAAIPLHDALGGAHRWGPFLVEALGTAVGVGAVQLAIGELLPGGAQRRRDVVSSFTPLLRRVWPPTRSTP